MLLGIPKEVKNHEYRVALTPAGVNALTQAGHQVRVEHNAGAGSAISDDEYVQAGAQIETSVENLWAEAEMIVKVKEPIAEEYNRMHAGQLLFTYLHLAASRPCTEALLSSHVTSIAYETVQLANRSLPLLAPMSEVAGRLSAQVAAHYLMAPHGGRGMLPGGVPGVPQSNFIVLGAGVSGLNAAIVALGLGARVTIFDLDIEKLRAIDFAYKGTIATRYSTPHAVADAVTDADAVIGAVLIPGASAPKLVTTEMVASMLPGSVLVDIAIDQGGCFEDSRPTTHDAPTFMVEQSQFYCVANMPGAVPRTSTFALAGATLPYVMQLAQYGWKQACGQSDPLKAGLATHDGTLLSAAVGQALGLPWETPDMFIPRSVPDPTAG